MRITAAALFLCACTATPASPPISQQSQELAGGTPDTGDASTVALVLPSVLVPGTTDYCTGSVIGQRTVLTSGTCVQVHLAVLTQGTIFIGRDATGSGRSIAIVGSRTHRLYNPAVAGTYDVAVVYLASDAGVAPVDLNASDLGAIAKLGIDMIYTVGYGSTTASDPTGIDGGPNSSAAGQRRNLSMILGNLSSHIVTWGYGTCLGDTGAPGFFTIGGGPVQVAVVGAGTDCTNATVGARVDDVIQDFIYPALDANEGACKVDGICQTVGCRTPDPDCPENACGPQGICTPGCPQPDWDCPIGGLFGDTCTSDTDCEGRLCVTAPDNPDRHYCSISCDSTLFGDCGPPTEISCQAVDASRHACVFTPPSPGEQDHTCTSNGECHSGFCDIEFHVCVNACTPGDGTCKGEDTCEPTSLTPFACRPPQPDTGCELSIGRRLRGLGGAMALLALVAAAVIYPVARRKLRRRGSSSKSTM